MIGALIGVKQLPEDMLGQLLKFDCMQENRKNKWCKRPSLVSVKREALPNINELITKWLPKKELKVRIEDRKIK